MHMILLISLPFGKKQEQAQQQGEGAPAQPDDEARLRLYSLIIERYRDKIEEGEQKTVSDLKGMVQPHDPKVAKIRDSITEQFHPYVYEENFLSAAKMAFEFVCSFRTMSAPLPFWLGFADMEELMAGDEMDKSLLLCSLLRSLGSENSKVFVTDSRNSYVLFQFSGKSFVADHSQKGLLEKESGAEALSCLKGKIMYSFNDKEYEDFQEEG